MESLYREIELPLCTTLYGMEREGVAVDRNTLEGFGQMLTGRIAACEQSIFEDAGGIQHQFHQTAGRGAL